MTHRYENWMLLRRMTKDESTLRGIEPLTKINFLLDRGWKRFSIYNAWVDPITGKELSTEEAFSKQLSRESVD